VQTEKKFLGQLYDTIESMQLYRHYKKSRKTSYFFSLLSLLLLHACATTLMTSTWMDESYRGGTLTNILIMGVMVPPGMQREVEERLAKQLQKRGLKAVAGHTLFSADSVPGREEIEKMTRELGVDAVCVVRLVDIDDIRLYLTYPPDQRTSLYNFYSYCCQNVISSGYQVRFETKIFNAKDGKLIWSGLSDTESEKSHETITESYIDALLQNLSARGLVP
jgi:hypothetical protein